MNQVKKTVYKIRLKLVYLRNHISFFFQRNNSLKINILSSPKYQNKVKEDLYLQKYLLKNHIASKILSWNDANDAEYTLIRSVWGYHKNLDLFKDYLQQHNTINSKSIILDNMNKKKQYELLQKNSIPTISTEFISDLSEYHFHNKKQVIKPIISAGGDDTVLIEKEDDIHKCKSNSFLMIQPYIEEIEKGEISVIVINQNIQYGIIRHPGVLSSYQKEEYLSLSDIPSSIINIANKIISIKEYQEVVFMRIDFLENQNQYEVLEVEQVDPDLFIETIPSKDLKGKIYQTLVDAIKKSIKR